MNLPSCFAGSRRAAARRLAILAMPAYLTLWLGVTSAAEPLPLHGECSLRFATVSEAREHLARRDSYLKAVGKFDREIRLRRADASLAEYVEFLQQQVLPWEAAQQQRLMDAVAAVRARLAPWQLPLPATIWLVRTTGREESGAAYCRQNAIVLPRPFDDREPAELERLLLHELFHVLSSHNPQLRRAMYSAIGFHVIDPVALPDALHDRKITNPDAPHVDCFLWVPHEGRQIAAGPILVSKAPFTDGERRSMFQLLEFRLVALELNAARTSGTIQLVDERPVLLNPDQPAFYWNVGLNTSYIIHPDEILADNFVHLMRDEQNLPTPRIIEVLARLLRPENIP